MASQLKVDTLTGVTTAGSIVVTGEGNSTTTNLQQGLAKCWVNFDGTDTIASRDSFNTTSITDNATGDYSITIANNMANDDYAHAGNSGGANGTSAGAVYANDQSTARTTTLFRVYTLHSNTNTVDTPTINIIVSGDLA